MARISYRGEGTAFRKLLNHSPALSDAYWAVREALNKGEVPAKIRMLSFLACDRTNRCRY